jgi:hypothetical protein
MIDGADLDRFTTSQLHDRAIGFAKANGDLDWLWGLLRSIPAAEGQVGEIEDSGMDIAATVSAINSYLRADLELSEILRSRYIGYILEQQ